MVVPSWGSRGEKTVRAGTGARIATAPTSSRGQLRVGGMCRVWQHERIQQILILNTDMGRKIQR